MKRVNVALVVICALAVGTLPTLGTTNYWDNNGDTAGFGTAGGTWGIEPKWSADGTGASVPSVTNTTAADDLLFGTSARGLAAGTITVDGTNQAFRSITFGAASGAIMLSGGTFCLAAPDSKVIINNYSNTIASVLAGTNGLNKFKPDSLLIYTNFLTSSPVTLFTNATLSDYVDLKAIMSGSYISGGSTPATPFYFINNGTNLTVQMQASNGGYTKCVKLELTQSGPDIAGRAIYAKYYNDGQLGFNFDTGGTLGTIATSSSAAGYGITQLSLIGVRVLTLTGVNTYSGDTTIGSGTLEIGGAGQLGSGSYTGAIINSGQLLYNSSASQKLYGVISGAGSLVKESPAKTVSSLTYSSFLTTTPTVVFPNAALADCVGADGMMGGLAISGTPYPADAYHFSNQGTNITYQMQATNDVYTKCVKVELTQVGLDIAARAVYAKYISGFQLGFDFDTGGNSFNIAPSYTSDGYGVAETTLSISLHSKLTLAATNTYTGGTTVNRGTLEATTTASALPSTGAITVNSGGELVLKVGSMNVGNTGGVGNGNPIMVNPGGTLTLSTNFNAGYSRPITINGGTLNSTFFENNDGANYINNLTLQNGARVTGYKVRVGYNSSAAIVVSGTNASSIAAGLNMVKSSNYTLTFQVADVTGDAGVDLSVPGVIRDYDSAGFAGMPMIKTGTGILSFSGANTHTGPITITAGTLALGATNTLNSGNSIVLNGGTLDMGSSTNALGTLTVVTNSVIALGSGKLVFADCSVTNWTGSLTLTNTLDAQTLRFGTNSAALTSAQLSAIKLNGKRVRIRENGYLAPTLKGTLICLQ